ncbi:Tudor domain containing 1, partial [Caligus rogercresseyi]
IILYHCSKDQTLYRGKITAYDSRKKKARLFLIDFGHICIASYSKLYAMDKDLISVPPFAIVATLKDVERFFPL